MTTFFHQKLKFPEEVLRIFSSLDALPRNSIPIRCCGEGDISGYRQNHRYHHHHHHHAGIVLTILLLALFSIISVSITRSPRPAHRRPSSSGSGAPSPAFFATAIAVPIERLSCPSAPAAAHYDDAAHEAYYWPMNSTFIGTEAQPCTTNHFKIVTAPLVALKVSGTSGANGPEDPLNPMHTAVIAKNAHFVGTMLAVDMTTYAFLSVADGAMATATDYNYYVNSRVTVHVENCIFESMDSAFEWNGFYVSGNPPAGTQITLRDNRFSLSETVVRDTDLAGLWGLIVFTSMWISDTVDPTAMRLPSEIISKLIASSSSSHSPSSSSPSAFLRVPERYDAATRPTQILVEGNDVQLHVKEIHVDHLGAVAINLLNLTNTKFILRSNNFNVSRIYPTVKGIVAPETYSTMGVVCVFQLTIGNSSGVIVEGNNFSMLVVEPRNSATLVLSIGILTLATLSVYDRSVLKIHSNNFFTGALNFSNFPSAYLGHIHVGNSFFGCGSGSLVSISHNVARSEQYRTNDLSRSINFYRCTMSYFQGGGGGDLSRIRTLSSSVTPPQPRRINDYLSDEIDMIRAELQLQNLNSATQAITSEDDDQLQLLGATLFPFSDPNPTSEFDESDLRSPFLGQNILVRRVGSPMLTLIFNNSVDALEVDLNVSVSLSIRFELSYSSNAVNVTDRSDLSPVRGPRSHPFYSDALTAAGLGNDGAFSTIYIARNQIQHRYHTQTDSIRQFFSLASVQFTGNKFAVIYTQNLQTELFARRNYSRVLVAHFENAPFKQGAALKITNNSFASFHSDIAVILDNPNRILPRTKYYNKVLLETQSFQRSIDPTTLPDYHRGFGALCLESSFLALTVTPASLSYERDRENGGNFSFVGNRFSVELASRYSHLCNISFVFTYQDFPIVGNYFGLFMNSSVIDSEEADFGSEDEIWGYNEHVGTGIMGSSSRGLLARGAIHALYGIFSDLFIDKSVVVGGSYEIRQNEFYFEIDQPISTNASSFSSPSALSSANRRWIGGVNTLAFVTTTYSFRSGSPPNTISSHSKVLILNNTMTLVTKRPRAVAATDNSAENNNKNDNFFSLDEALVDPAVQPFSLATNWFHQRFRRHFIFMGGFVIDDAGEVKFEGNRMHSSFVTTTLGEEESVRNMGTIVFGDQKKRWNNSRSARPVFISPSPFENETATIAGRRINSSDNSWERTNVPQPMPFYAGIVVVDATLENSGMFLIRENKYNVDRINQSTMIANREWRWTTKGAETVGTVVVTTERKNSLNPLHGGQEFSTLINNSLSKLEPSLALLQQKRANAVVNGEEGNNPIRQCMLQKHDVFLFALRITARTNAAHMSVIGNRYEHAIGATLPSVMVVTNRNGSSLMATGDDMEDDLSLLSQISSECSCGSSSSSCSTSPAPSSSSSCAATAMAAILMTLASPSIALVNGGLILERFGAFVIDNNHLITQHASLTIVSGLGHTGGTASKSSQIEDEEDHHGGIIRNATNALKTAMAMITMSTTANAENLTSSAAASASGSSSLLISTIVDTFLLLRDIGGARSTLSQVAVGPSTLANTILASTLALPCSPAAMSSVVAFCGGNVTVSNLSYISVLEVVVEYKATPKTAANRDAFSITVNTDDEISSQSSAATSTPFVVYGALVTFDIVGDRLSNSHVSSSSHSSSLQCSLDAFIQLGFHKESRASSLPKLTLLDAMLGGNESIDGAPQQPMLFHVGAVVQILGGGSSSVGNGTRSTISSQNPPSSSHFSLNSCTMTLAGGKVASQTESSPSLRPRSSHPPLPFAVMRVRGDWFDKYNTNLSFINTQSVSSSSQATSTPVVTDNENVEFLVSISNSSSIQLSKWALVEQRVVRLLASNLTRIVVDTDVDDEAATTSVATTDTALTPPPSPLSTTAAAEKEINSATASVMVPVALPRSTARHIFTPFWVSGRSTMVRIQGASGIIIEDNHRVVASVFVFVGNESMNVSSPHSPTTITTAAANAEVSEVSPSHRLWPPCCGWCQSSSPLSPSVIGALFDSGSSLKLSSLSSLNGSEGARKEGGGKESDGDSGGGGFVITRNAITERTFIGLASEFILAGVNVSSSSPTLNTSDSFLNKISGNLFFKVKSSSRGNDIDNLFEFLLFFGTPASDAFSTSPLAERQLYEANPFYHDHLSVSSSMAHDSGIRIIPWTSVTDDGGSPLLGTNFFANAAMERKIGQQQQQQEDKDGLISFMLALSFQTMMTTRGESESSNPSYSLFSAVGGATVYTHLATVIPDNSPSSLAKRNPRYRRGDEAFLGLRITNNGMYSSGAPAREVLVLINSSTKKNERSSSNSAVMKIRDDIFPLLTLHSDGGGGGNNQWEPSVIRFFRQRNESVILSAIAENDDDLTRRSVILIANRDPSPSSVSSPVTAAANAFTRLVGTAIFVCNNTMRRVVSGDGESSAGFFSSEPLFINGIDHSLWESTNRISSPRFIRQEEEENQQQQQLFFDVDFLCGALTASGTIAPSASGTRELTTTVPHSSTETKASTRTMTAMRTVTGPTMSPSPSKNSRSPSISLSNPSKTVSNPSVSGSVSESAIPPPIVPPPTAPDLRPVREDSERASTSVIVAGGGIFAPRAGGQASLAMAAIRISIICGSSRGDGDDGDDDSFSSGGVINNRPGSTFGGSGDGDDDSDAIDEPLSPFVHPLAFSIGNGPYRYLMAAVIGNTVIIPAALFLLIRFPIFFVLRRFLLPGNPSFESTAQFLGWPSIMNIPLSVLAEGTSSVVVTLLVAPHSSSVAPSSSFSAAAATIVGPVGALLMCASIALWAYVYWCKLRPLPIALERVEWGGDDDDDEKDGVARDEEGKEGGSLEARLTQTRSNEARRLIPPTLALKALWLITPLFERGPRAVETATIEASTPHAINMGEGGGTPAPSSAAVSPSLPSTSTTAESVESALEIYAHLFGDNLLLSAELLCVICSVIVGIVEGLLTAAPSASDSACRETSTVLLIFALLQSALSCLTTVPSEFLVQILMAICLLLLSLSAIDGAYNSSGDGGGFLSGEAEEALGLAINILSFFGMALGLCIALVKLFHRRRFLSMAVLAKLHLGSNMTRWSGRRLTAAREREEKVRRRDYRSAVNLLLMNQGPSASASAAIEDEDDIEMIAREISRAAREKQQSEGSNRELDLLGTQQSAPTARNGGGGDVIDLFLEDIQVDVQRAETSKRTKNTVKQRK